MNEPEFSSSLTPTTRLEVVQGDLTQEPVDAIVNAANEHLAHGGGIAAAISHAGGPSIQADSNAYVREHGPVTHDRPGYTKAGKLPAKWILHAVGPVWGSGDEDRKLATAISSTLELADGLQLESIAFPAISIGIFRFPKERAARIFFQTFQEYFKSHSSGLKLVKMVLWDTDTLNVFTAAAQQVLGSQE